MSNERNTFIENQTANLVRAYSALRNDLEQKGLVQVEEVNTILEAIRKEVGILLNDDEQAIPPQVTEGEISGPEFIEKFGELSGLVQRYTDFQQEWKGEIPGRRKMEEQIVKLLCALEKRDPETAKRLVKALCDLYGDKFDFGVCHDLFLSPYVLGQQSTTFRELSDEIMSKYSRPITQEEIDRKLTAAISQLPDLDLDRESALKLERWLSKEQKAKLLGEMSLEQ